MASLFTGTSPLARFRAAGMQNRSPRRRRGFPARRAWHSRASVSPARASCAAARACSSAVIDQKLDAALLHRQPDAVAVAHQAERAAGGGIGRDVQHDGAEGGAAHARVGDADHVLDAVLRELLRDRQIAGLRHRLGRSAGRRSAAPECPAASTSSAGSSMRAARSASEENTTALPSCSNSLASAAERLRIAPLRREIAEQRDQPALRLERLLARGDDGAVDVGAGSSGRKPLAQASRRSRSGNRDAAAASTRAAARPCRRRRRSPPCSRCRPA